MKHRSSNIDLNILNYSTGERHGVPMSVSFRQVILNTTLMFKVCWVLNCFYGFKFTSSCKYNSDNSS